jgi:predicted dinucleotide-binding enzyme
MEKIAVLGSGPVGQTLADGFIKHGYSVMRGSREPAKLEAWKSAAGDKGRIGSFEDAASFGDIIVLAVKGGAAESVLELAGLRNLEGKTILDTTNPIADKPPVNGVIQFFTGPNESLMERLQAKAPAARFVKAFSCVGNAFMVNPSFADQKPTMFICGSNADAKRQANDVLKRFGWEVEDFGDIESARAIEPLCMLWCIPGMRGGGWSHAFKLLKK